MDLLVRISGQRAVEESSGQYRPSNLIGVWKGVRKQRGIHHNGSTTGGIFYWSCIRVPEIKRRSRRVPHIHLTSALLFLTSKWGSRFGPFGPAAAPVNAFQAQ